MPILVFFIFIQIFIEHSVIKQRRRSDAFELGLHCFSMSHKKNARLIKANTCLIASSADNRRKQSKPDLNSNYLTLC